MIKSSCNKGWNQADLNTHKFSLLFLYFRPKSSANYQNISYWYSPYILAMQTLYWKHSGQGPFLKGPKRFSHLESHSKISNLWLQSGFIHIFLKWTEVSFIQNVSGLYSSPEKFPRLSRNGPQDKSVLKSLFSFADTMLLHQRESLVTALDIDIIRGGLRWWVGQIIFLIRGRKSV